MRLRDLLTVMLTLSLSLASAFVGEAKAGVYASQAEAYAACLYEVTSRPPQTPPLDCKFVDNGTGAFGNTINCAAYGLDGQADSLYQAVQTYSPPSSIGLPKYWCVRMTCDAGWTPDGATEHSYTGFGMATGTHERAGCCVTMHLISAGKGATEPDSGGYTTGWWVGTGARCNAQGADVGNKRLPVVPQLSPACEAGDAACWNPDGNKVCLVTESGQGLCVPLNPPPGGCISGATGSICVGKDGAPVPTPPDPPIPKDTPPNNTTNITVNNGGTTSNYTVNNYSGTSPGGGGGEAGAPGTSGSPGGSGSNTKGSGNSGKNGTDANGKCPNGSMPTASGCSGTYTDNGCDTPPACYGDAVLCGIAANTHKEACVQAASGSSSGGPPGGLGDGTDSSGDHTAAEVSNTVDAGDAAGNLNSGGFGFATSCPIHDVTLSVMGKTVVIPLQDKCDLLAFLRYVVLGLAFFAATKIIAGVQ